MNVIKDVTFRGRILDQVRQAVDYIKTQMKEKTYLGNNGIFVTEAEYSEFVRTEIVVNAAAHRDYSIRGTDIQIKMFDNRLEVDSPGVLPGMVKKENIRYTHFSRNPKIAAFLKDYGYVKEYGEGVDRMCRELEAIGLPDPIFNNNTFILKTTVMSSSFEHHSMKEVSDLAQNLPVENREVSDLEEKWQIENSKMSDSKEIIPKKISLKTFVSCYVNKGYNEPTQMLLNQIYEMIDTNQVFGTSYLVKMLKCSDRTARRLILKLSDMDVIVPVSGKGKGKYRLKIESE